MQIIEKNGKPFKIIADEEMKLTKNREFFVNVVYLGINDKVENYEEVPYEVWGLLLDDEIPKNKVEKLESSIEMLKTTQIELGELLLDTDFRLMCLEMGITP